MKLSPKLRKPSARRAFVVYTAKTRLSGSAASTAVHHGFDLIGIETVCGVQRLDGVVELIERHERGDTNLGTAGVNVDMIVQAGASVGTADISFTVPESAVKQVQSRFGSVRGSMPSGTTNVPGRRENEERTCSGMLKR